MPEGDIFEGGTTPENFVDKFVGEGKKFKSVEELAKAYEHANNHIPELQKDLQSTREFIADKLEELAKKREATPPGQTEGSGTPTPAPVSPPNDAGEDLDTRIAKIMEKTRVQERYQANASLVQEVLVEQLGSVEAAQKLVIEKAMELGVDGAYMKQTASTSPKAFFNLLGINPDEKPVSSSTPAPSSDVDVRRMESTNPVKAGTYAYYNQLRKSDPKLYWSQKVQTAMHKDAQNNPDFFNR